MRFFCYLLLALTLLWILAVQAGCLAMRTPDRDWHPKMAKRGQHLLPQFVDVQMPTPHRRTVHAVHLDQPDTLPVVMLVHGSPGSADAYLNYLADTVLSRSAHVVTLDRPGFGYTSGFGKPEPSQAAQAAAVLAVLDRVAPGQRAVLVGHSLGGPVVCRFAMDYPERTVGLVVVAGSIDPALEPHPWWQPVVHAPPVRWLTPKSLWTSNAEIIPLERELEAMLPMWSRIVCPVRVLHATDDRLVPVANTDFARRMLTHCPDLKIEVLPTGDHFILWSQQDVVRRAILELAQKP